MSRRAASLVADRFHPLAAVFPLLEGAPFDALVDDIRAHGLREPIVEYEGRILDGRNRYGACLRAGAEPRFVDFGGADPIGFVLSANLHRRHLNESQRGMVVARVATLPRGRPANGSREPITASVAGQLEVSAATSKRAKVVLARGVPSLVRRVEQGGLTVSVAAQVATLPAAEQEALAGQPEPKLRGAVKQAARARRERALAGRAADASAELGSTLYSVIYADPPWRFEPYSRDSGLDRAADNHYPTLDVAGIRAIRPPAAPDCALFLWATAPMLCQALSVIEAWGFAYKSHCVWAKHRVGTGYWFRNQHELLLVATRGATPAPAPGQQYASLLIAGAGPHSRKPDAFAEMIEEMFPSTKLLEMFARAPRPGWDVWGNEVAAARPATAPEETNDPEPDA